MKINRSYFLIILSGLFLFGAIFNADGQGRKDKKKRPKATGESYLFGGKIGNKDTIPVALFDSLIQKKLFVFDDSTQQFYPAYSYDLIYAKLGVYTDKTGHPIIKCDYISTESNKGVIPNYWYKAFVHEVKAGDTAIFTDVRYRIDSSKSGKLLYGRTFRVILTP